MHLHFTICENIFDEESLISVTFFNNIFDDKSLEVDNITLKAVKFDGEHKIGTSFFDGERRTAIGYYDIDICNKETGASLTFDGTVTVTIPIPAEYIGKKDFKIVHIHDDGTRENFSTDSVYSEKVITVSDDGKYLTFGVKSFSKFEITAFEAYNAPSAPTISIKNNSGSATINYGETLKLTAVTANKPADAKIEWYVDGVKKGEGETFSVSPESGSVNVTVKLVDKDGNESYGTNISDSQTVKVKSGFFQKLISFFKNLFGINRVITQSLNLK